MLRTLHHSGDGGKGGSVGKEFSSVHIRILKAGFGGKQRETKKADQPLPRWLLSNREESHGTITNLPNL